MLFAQDVIVSTNKPFVRISNVGHWQQLHMQLYHIGTRQVLEMWEVDIRLSSILFPNVNVKCALSASLVERRPICGPAWLPLAHAVY